MNREELRNKMLEVEKEVENISYELSNLLKNKDQIPTEQYQESERELKELLDKQTKDLNDYRMQLEAMAKEDEIELTGLAKEDKAKVDADIAKAKEELEASKKEFEKYTNIMMDTYKDTSTKLQSGPMENEELEKIYDDYFATMYKNEAIWNDLKSRMAKLERKRKRLETKGRKIIEDVISAENLGLEYEQYKEIMKTLKSRNRLKEILDSKGLSDIVHKRGGRSKVEKETLETAKNEIINEILNAMSKDEKLSITDAINVLYYNNEKVIRKEESRPLQLPSKMYDNLTDNIKLLPAAIPQVENKTKVITKDTPAAPEGIPRSTVLDNGYVPVSAEYRARGFETPEELIKANFEEKTGTAFDPEKHELIIHDADGTLSDDDVYNEYEIVEKVSEKEEEKPKEKVLGEMLDNGYVPVSAEYRARGFETPEELIKANFEEKTGTAFDPEKHELIIHDADGTLSDDDVYNEYEIREIINEDEIEPTEIVPEDNTMDNPTNDEIPLLPGETIDGRRVGYGDDRDGVTPRLTDGNGDNELSSDDIKHDIDDIMDGIDLEEDKEPSNKDPEDEDGKDEEKDEEDDKKPPVVIPTDGDIPDDDNTPEDKEEDDKDKGEDESTKGPKPIEPRELGLREIINGKICKDLNITKKDGSKYRWKNAKITKTFWDELHSGNYLYNIVHVVPGLIKLAGSAVMKLARGLFGTKKATDLVAEMKERIDKLSPKELETLFKGYRGGFVVQEGYPQVVNMVIEEKMNEYILGKVNTLNNEMNAAYKIVITSYRQLTALDEKLRDKSLKPEARAKLKAERKALLANAAANCKDIRAMQEEAKELLSGGLHGMSEDMRATASKMNIIGMRFAKTYDYDNELEDRLEKAQTKYLDGVHNGDDQAILSGFMQEEKLLAENTDENMSVFGVRSTGKKHYFPLAEMLDYRQDPFVKDLFTTIAVTSAAISAANAIRVNAEQQRILEAHQEEVARVNADNAQTMGQVNQTGAEIAGKRDVFSEGMRAQAEQNILSRTNVHERGSLDQTNWSIGTEDYHILDHARHEAARDFYTDTYTQMTDVSSRLANGSISDAQALQELANIATQSHKTFTDTVSDLLQVTRDYAAAHPQHDLTAVLGTMEYFAKNPDIISQMNQGMVDVTNLGESLIGLSAEQVSMIQSLPSDLATTLVAAASSAALAYNVSRDMNRKYHKRSHKNEVTDMMDDLLYEEYEKEEQEELKK